MTCALGEVLFATVALLVGGPASETSRYASKRLAMGLRRRLRELAALIRPHASIRYKPPAPEVFVPAFAAWPAALRRPAPPATLAQRPTLN